MHVLCLSHYYPPETGALATRMSEHSRAWAAMGMQVTVVTCVPNYPKGRVFPGYRNRFFQREVVDGVTVIRLWSLIAANEGIVLRTLNYVSFLVSVVLASPWLPRPDVIISTSPNLFCGVAGGLLAILKRRPWVFEVRDLWPESIVAVGALKNRALIAPFAYLERWAYRRATAIVPVADSFVAHIVAHGGRREAIRVIKNGVDLQRIARGEGDRFRDRLGLQRKVIVSYVGTHGMAHRLETVLEAADRLRVRSDIAFIMVGDGAERGRLMELCEARKLENMHFVGEVPASEIPDVMAGSDISLVVLARKDLFLSVIPSKMFEAMAAGKPVVMGVAGEAAAILEAAQAGVCVEPENVDELVKAIQRLADSPALRTEMGEQGREFVTRHFDRSRLARAYGVFLEHVAGKAPRGVESGVEQMVPVGGDTSLWHPREPSGVEPSQ